MSKESKSVFEKIVRRPVASAVLLVGLLIVALFATIAARLQISANGCIDQQAGRQKAREVDEERRKAAALGDRNLQAYYRHEAERQEQYNREAERSCGQKGIPFDLAMKRIEVLQSFLGLLATVMFGFCTLASVLVSVTMRDEGEDRKLDGNAGGDRPDGAVTGQHGNEVDHEISSSQLPSKQPSSAIGEAAPTTGSRADNSADPVASGSLAVKAAQSTNPMRPVLIGITLGLATTLFMVGAKFGRRRLNLFVRRKALI